MRAALLTCLLTIIGMPIGCLGGSYVAAREAAELRQKRPDLYVCGLFALPYLFFGSLLGGVTFGIAGVTLGVPLPN